MAVYRQDRVYKDYTSIPTPTYIVFSMLSFCGLHCEIAGNSNGGEEEMM